MLRIAVRESPQTFHDMRPFLWHGVSENGPPRFPAGADLQAPVTALVLGVLLNGFHDGHSDPCLQHEGGEIEVVSVLFAVGDALFARFEGR